MDHPAALNWWVWFYIISLDTDSTVMTAGTRCAGWSIKRQRHGTWLVLEITLALSTLMPSAFLAGSFCCGGPWVARNNIHVYVYSRTDTSLFHQIAIVYFNIYTYTCSGTRYKTTSINWYPCAACKALSYACTQPYMCMCHTAKPLGLGSKPKTWSYGIRF